MEKFEERTSNIGNAASRKRQQILSNILASSTEAFIKQVNLQSQLNALDLGCGTGETTFLLSDAINRAGKIIGLDSKETQLKIARENAHQNELSQVEFRYQNIHEWEEYQSYDLVYSRYFFHQLREPLSMLQKVFNSLKPGGLAMIEDLDFSKFQCFPNSYAFDRFTELYIEVVKKQGADPNIDKQIYPLFQLAGFKNCQVQLVRPKFLTGKNKRIASLTLESISTILEKENLASHAELQALLSELKSFEALKNTMISLPGIYQVWGYRQ